VAYNNIEPGSTERNVSPAEKANGIEARRYVRVSFAFRCPGDEQWKDGWIQAVFIKIDGKWEQEGNGFPCLDYSSSLPNCRGGLTLGEQCELSHYPLRYLEAILMLIEDPDGLLEILTGEYGDDVAHNYMVAIGNASGQVQEDSGDWHLNLKRIEETMKEYNSGELTSEHQELLDWLKEHQSDIEKSAEVGYIYIHH